MWVENPSRVQYNERQRQQTALDQNEEGTMLVAMMVGIEIGCPLPIAVAVARYNCVVVRGDSLCKMRDDDDDDVNDAEPEKEAMGNGNYMLKKERREKRRRKNDILVEMDHLFYNITCVVVFLLQ